MKYWRPLALLITFCMFACLAFSTLQTPSVFAASPAFVLAIHEDE